MKKKTQKPKKISKFIYWAPRIISIIFILFLSMFALDIFDMNLGFFGTIVGLFMHLIPSFILVIALLIAWRWEIVGAIAFILGGLLYIIMLVMSPFEWYKVSWALIIAGPAFVVGILWLVNWYLKKK